MENFFEEKAQKLFVLNFVERSRYNFLLLDYEDQLKAFNYEDNLLIDFIRYYPMIETKISIERRTSRHFLEDNAENNGVRYFVDWIKGVYSKFGILVKNSDSCAIDLINELAAEYRIPAESLLETMLESEFIKKLN